MHIEGTHTEEGSGLDLGFVLRCDGFLGIGRARSLALLGSRNARTHNLLQGLQHQPTAASRVSRVVMAISLDSWDTERVAARSKKRERARLARLKHSGGACTRTKSKGITPRATAHRHMWQCECAVAYVRTYPLHCKFRHTQKILKIDLLCKTTAAHTHRDVRIHMPHMPRARHWCPHIYVLSPESRTIFEPPLPSRAIRTRSQRHAPSSGRIAVSMQSAGGVRRAPSQSPPISPPASVRRACCPQARGLLQGSPAAHPTLCRHLTPAAAAAPSRSPPSPCRRRPAGSANAQEDEPCNPRRAATSTRRAERRRYLSDEPNEVC